MQAAVAAAVHHPIAELLNQVLLLVGYFCVLAPSNQAMLQWGNSPNILQRLCSMPFQYFTTPPLWAVAMPTLLAVCYGADRTCEIVAQHVSLEVLLQHVQQELQRLQQPGQQQVHQHMQLLLPPQTSPPGSQDSGSTAACCPHQSKGSSNSSSSSSQFSLAKRFPLEALQQAEAYLLKQLQAQRAASACTKQVACNDAGESARAAAAALTPAACE